MHVCVWVTTVLFVTSEKKDLDRKMPFFLFLERWSGQYPSFYSPLLDPKDTDPTRISLSFLLLFFLLTISPNNTPSFSFKVWIVHPRYIPLCLESQVSDFHFGITFHASCYPWLLTNSDFFFLHHETRVQINRRKWLKDKRWRESEMEKRILPFFLLSFKCSKVWVWSEPRKVPLSE